MLPNLSEIYYPANLSEAIKILKKGKGNIIPLAGCTGIGMMENPRIVGLVDLEPLKLNFVRTSGKSLVIGAGLTITELIENKTVRKYCGGILSEAGSTIGKITNRNMITVGGNIVQLHPWSALPVALFSLDAQIIVAGTKRRRLTASQFFSKPPKQIISYDEIVTEIQLPSEFANAVGKYQKFALTENDYPLVSFAVVVKKKNGKIEDLRLTVGALTLLPQRLTEAEKSLAGTNPDRGQIAEIIEYNVGKLNIANDFRASKDYKKIITRNLLTEILNDILKG